MTKAKKAVFIKGLAQDGITKVAGMSPYYKDIKLQLAGNNNLDIFGKIQGIENTYMCFNGTQCKMGIPDILVNCMADADALQQRLEFLGTVIPKLKKQNPKLKVINHPAGILKTKRNDIYEQFKSLDGIIVPKAIKIFPKSRRELIENIKSQKMKLPVLVREAGIHGGIKLTQLKDFSEDEIEQLDKFAFDGRGFYATEFHDFKSKDGHYRKVRIVMIGGVPHLRHMIVGNHWNIHANSREEFMNKHPELAEEEKNFLQKGLGNFSKEVQASLLKVYKTLGLDIFGMDVGILPNGKLLVFEINAAMEFIAPHVKHAPYIIDQIRAIKLSFLKLIASAPVIPKTKLTKAA